MAWVLRVYAEWMSAPRALAHHQTITNWTSYYFAEALLS
jgi:hypothetical protein